MKQGCRRDTQPMARRAGGRSGILWRSSCFGGQNRGMDHPKSEVEWQGWLDLLDSSRRSQRERLPRSCHSLPENWADGLKLTRNLPYTIYWSVQNSTGPRQRRFHHGRCMRVVDSLARVAMWSQSRFFIRQPSRCQMANKLLVITSW
jgi:hypothetical protein